MNLFDEFKTTISVDTPNAQLAVLVKPQWIHICSGDPYSIIDS